MGVCIGLASIETDTGEKHNGPWDGGCADDQQWERDRMAAWHNRAVEWVKLYWANTVETFSSSYPTADKSKHSYHGRESPGRAPIGQSKRQSLETELRVENLITLMDDSTGPAPWNGRILFSNSFDIVPIRDTMFT